MRFAHIPVLCRRSRRYALCTMHSELVAIRHQIIERARVVFTRAVADDVAAGEEIVDRERDIVFGIRRIFGREAGEEIRFLRIGMRVGRAHDAIGEIREIDRRTPFSFFIAEAARHDPAAERAIPIIFDGRFFRELDRFRILVRDAQMPREAALRFGADGKFDAAVFEIFVDGVIQIVFLREGNIILDSFGEERELVLAGFRFLFPADFVMRALLRFQIRIADDVRRIGNADMRIHLRKRRQHEGLAGGYVETFVFGNFMQILRLPAEISEIFVRAARPGPAKTGGENIFFRQFPFPGSEEGENISAEIDRSALVHFADEGAAHEEGVAFGCIPHFLDIKAVRAIRFRRRFHRRRCIFLAGGRVIIQAVGGKCVPIEEDVTGKSGQIPEIELREIFGFIVGPRVARDAVQIGARRIRDAGKLIIPMRRRFVVIVENVEFVVDFVRHENIVFLGAEEMILHVDGGALFGECGEIIGGNARFAPFIVAVRDGETAFGKGDFIISAPEFSESHANRIRHFFFRDDIDDAAGRLAAVHDGRAAADDFDALDRFRRNIFQIIHIAPIDRRAVQHDDGPVFDTANHELTRHRGKRGAVRAAAVLDEAVHILERGEHVVAAGLLDILGRIRLRGRGDFDIFFQIAIGGDDDGIEIVFGNGRRLGIRKGAGQNGSAKNIVCPVSHMNSSFLFETAKCGFPFPTFLGLFIGC